MIRQTTTIPVVAPPTPEPAQINGVGRRLFILVEVVLLASIPLLGFIGFRSLLETRAGEFVVDPGPSDPGWVAAVESSPLSLLVDVDGDDVGGAALVAPGGVEAAGGTVILISGATIVDGSPLSTRSPSGIAAALEEALRLDIGEPAVLDAEGWELLLGGESIELANPDPVTANQDAPAEGVQGDPDGLVEDGEPAVLVPAGRVTVAAGDLAALSTREPLVGSDSEALEFRRDVLWATLLDNATFDTGLVGSDALIEAAAHLDLVATGVHRLESMPTSSGAIDGDAAEELLRSAIALPLGHEVNARLQVRIVDRSGTNDLEAAARNLGSAGFEVVQIANAFTFDDGPTQVLVTPIGSPDEVARLADLADADTVPPSLDAEAASVVTLLLGPDAAIARSTE